MSSSNNWQSRLGRFSRSNVIDVVCAIAIVAYFLHFALPSLNGGFNQDEMTNMYVYWRPGALKSLWANICFWKGIGRPAGALYYLPLYHFFDLDPRPYRVVQIGILASSIPIVYYLARLLSSSPAVAFLAVLVFCYQPQLAGLVFVGSFIYDVLCGFFYFAALTYYIHIRDKGRSLRPTQLAAFFALYVCALNSKEMAVTLPVIVLIYETLRCLRLRDWIQFVRSNWRLAVPSFIAGLLTLPYIYGKTQGGSALARVTGYIPHYSWHTFTNANAHFVSELFYLVPNHGMTWGILLISWAAIFVYAFSRRDRLLELMALWVVITPLPLVFIPLRGGACLYILLFGWAMIVAKLISDAIGLLSKACILVSKGVRDGLTTGPFNEGMINRACNGAIGPLRGIVDGQMCARIFPIIATILVASAFAMFTQWENQRFGRIPALLGTGDKTAHVVEAFRSLNLHPASGSMILLKPENRFYQNGYYPTFVASLVWNDHSLQTYVAGQSQLTEQQILNMNYIISFGEFQLKVIRGPETVNRF